MPKKTPVEYPQFEEAQILWECDFPSRPELLESLLKERIWLKQKSDDMKIREKEINNSLLAFFTGNRIPGVKYEGYTISKKSGAAATINREALLKEGVAVEVIDRCISRTPWETVECREGKSKPSHEPA